MIPNIHDLQEHYPYLITGNKDGEKLQTINYIGLIIDPFPLKKEDNINILGW